jgi:hypothetical protein
VAEKVWTSAELDEMSRAEVDARFEQSMSLDLDSLPEEFLARVRERALRRIEGGSQPDR